MLEEERLMPAMIAQPHAQCHGYREGVGSSACLNIKGLLNFTLLIWQNRPITVVARLLVWWSLSPVWWQDAVGACVSSDGI